MPGSCRHDVEACPVPARRPPQPFPPPRACTRRDVPHTLAHMPQHGKGALTLPDPTGTVPDARLTKTQAAYLCAISEGAPTATAAAKAAGVRERQAQRWRASSDAFRQAEVAAWQVSLSARVPKALVSLDRLLDADLDHGAAGLAAVGRAVDRVLEGAGIIGKVGQPTVQVNLTPLSSVSAAITTEPPASFAPAPLPVLDADWAPVAEGVDPLPSNETPDPVRGSRANRDRVTEGKADRQQ